MKTFAITELFSLMEDSTATWLDSTGSVVTREALKKGMIATQALGKDGEASRAYFWLREQTTEGYGYTICEFSHSDSNMNLVSVCGQFLNERKAIEAVNAYAMGRVTMTLAFDSYRARKADNVAEILAYKRNAVRAQDVATFRAKQKLRTIPPQKEKQSQWLIDWLRSNLDESARKAIAAAIAD